MFYALYSVSMSERVKLICMQVVALNQCVPRLGDSICSYAHSTKLNSHMLIVEYFIKFASEFRVCLLISPKNLKLSDSFSMNFGYCSDNFGSTLFWNSCCLLFQFEFMWTCLSLAGMLDASKGTLGRAAAAMQIKKLTCSGN